MGETCHMAVFAPHEEPDIAVSSSASIPAPSAGAASAPKKFINVNGIAKLNPEWKK